MLGIQLVLRKIALWMQKYKFTRLLYRILFDLGLVPLKRYIFCLWFSKKPTQKMKDEKQFFSEHVQELKTVYDSLEDDRSRAVFENILKFRATYGWTYLKKSVGKDNLKTQYLVQELQFSEHEIIVDCGAYTGDTAECFFHKVPNCRVIALEPDEENFELLQKLKFPGLKCIKAGAWSEDTILSFLQNKGKGVGCGTIEASGDTRIEVKALDHIPECQSATFIKMDIEGAELEALKGAANIIKKMRPKLAICLYHKPQDFFEIPLYILELNPDYKLFVHHHSVYEYGETVLYAI